MSALERQWWQAGAGVALLLALILALYYPVVASLVTTWSDTVTYHHGFLVAPVSLWLGWRLRRPLMAEAPAPAPWALVILAGAGMVWLVGEAAESNLIRQLALVAMIIGTVLLGLGGRAGRRLWFPLLFLLFLVPLGDELIPALQDLTATLAVALVRAAGVPVFREGILLQTPGGLFEVAEACAGVRFLVATLFVVALFCYLSYRQWWKVVAMLVLAVAVPILANGMRAAGTVLIASWGSRQSAAGVDHLVYGWGFFAVVLALLLLIGERFADRRRADGPAADLGPAFPHRPIGANFGLVALPPPVLSRLRGRVGVGAAAAVILMAAPLYARLAFPPPPAEPSAWADTLVLPLVPGWNTEAASPEWTPTFPGADRRLQGRYRGAEGTVDLLVAAYASQRRGAGVLDHANRFADGSRWLRLAGSPLRLAAGALPPRARSERLASADGRSQRLVVWWYWVADRFTGDPITAKLLQVLARLGGHRAQAAVIALAADVTDTPADGLRLIELFLAALGDLPGGIAGLTKGPPDAP